MLKTNCLEKFKREVMEPSTYRLDTLDTLSLEEKKRLVNLLIEEITVTGKCIDIKAKIPDTIPENAGILETAATDNGFYGRHNPVQCCVYRRNEDPLLVNCLKLNEAYHHFLFALFN